MTSDRRTKLLLGFLALVVLVFAWQRLVPRLFAGGGDVDAANPASVATVDDLLAADGTVPAGAARPQRANRGRRSASTVPTNRVVALRLDQLNPSAAQFEGDRNPFSYFLPPPPPPPRPPGPTPEELEARRRAAEEAEARRRAAAEAAANDEPPKPRPPVVPYTYLGRFGPRNRPIAVLAEGDAIHNVLLGDVLDGKFRLRIRRAGVCRFSGCPGG